MGSAGLGKSVPTQARGLDRQCDEMPWIEALDLTEDGDRVSLCGKGGGNGVRPEQRLNVSIPDKLCHPSIRVLSESDFWDAELVHGVLLVRGCVHVPYHMEE